MQNIPKNTGTGLRYLAIIALIVAIGLPAMAQNFIVSPTNRSSIYYGIGNVGIGTNSPQSRLEITSGTKNASGLRLTNMTSALSSSVGPLPQPIGVNGNGDIVPIAGAIPTLSAPLATTMQAFALGAAGGTVNYNTNDLNDGGDGIGMIVGANVGSPTVWMYNYGNNNAFTVATKTYSGHGPGDIDGRLLPLFQVRSNGNVGIGTTSPQARLEVSSGTANSSGLRLTGLTSSSPVSAGQALGVDANGNVVTVAGGGTVAPVNYMQSYRGSISAYTMTNVFNLPVNTDPQYGDPAGTATMDMITNDHDGGGGFGLIGGNKTPFVASPVVWLYSNHVNAFTVAIKTTYTGSHPELAGDNMVPALQVRETGKVLIGKTSSSPGTNYLLDVAGDIRANKLTVNTTGADFVFDSSYNLAPLGELETYVKQNRHLPGIAPAAEMQEKGVDVGDIQIRLLQKIEELTRYAIQQNKDIELQQKNIGTLTMQLAEQGKAIRELKAKAQK